LLGYFCQALPKKIDNWSLTSLQQLLVKTGGRLVKHARYYWLLLAEDHLTRRVFGAIADFFLRRGLGTNDEHVIAEARRQLGAGIAPEAVVVDTTAVEIGST
jgi:hypothetical protein